MANLRDKIGDKQITIKHSNPCPDDSKKGIKAADKKDK